MGKSQAVGGKHEVADEIETFLESLDGFLNRFSLYFVLPR